jgi:hypothetical protein
VRATRVSHRLLLTVAAVCGALLPGFFDDEHGRKLVIVGGLLLLIWVTRVPMLGALKRLTATLAGASLWIYLTQPLTFHFMEWGQSLFDDPSAEAGSGSSSGADQSGLLHDLRLAAATVIALAVGVLAWKAYERAIRHVARLRTVRATFGEPGKDSGGGQKRTWPSSVQHPTSQSQRKLRQLRHRRAAAHAVHRTSPPG